MQKMPGRNGGQLNRPEKGESGNPKGRPPGSTSLKAIADKILDGVITVEEAEGKYSKMTRREAMLLRIIQDAVDDEDPNVRLKAAQIVMDRTEGKPLQKGEFEHSLGEQTAQTVLKISFRPPEDEQPIASPVPQKPKGARKKG